MLRQVMKTINLPLVRVSLVLGIIGAPPLWMSGIYIGQGREFLGAVFFIIYVLVYTIDALVTLTLLIKP